MATSPDNPSLTKQAFGKALFFSALVIPTLISITVALQFKSFKAAEAGPIEKEPQIVCFEPNICAIEVYKKWYRIDGVIVMDETVPEEYRLEELIEESSAEVGVNPEAGAKALKSVVNSTIKGVTSAAD